MMDREEFRAASAMESPSPTSPLANSSADSSRSAAARSGRWLGPALYPQTYLWFVFLASLDLMFTWIILRSGGSELNAVADQIIQRHDLPGTAAYKFGLVSLVLVICEVIGRQRPALGHKLAKWAVALTAFAVTVGGFHVLRIAMGTAEDSSPSQADADYFFPALSLVSSLASTLGAS